MLNVLRQRAERRRLSETLSAELMARARLAVFYSELRVADTIDGRFDLLVLHAWLVLDRLAAQGEQALAQGVVDALFVQFDEALRQQGASDMGMGRRMTKMADAFYGRLNAYRDAVQAGGLVPALLRNVYRGNGDRIEQAEALAMYATVARAHLAETDLTTGAADFGPAPKLAT